VAAFVAVMWGGYQSLAAKFDTVATKAALQPLVTKADLNVSTLDLKDTLHSVARELHDFGWRRVTELERVTQHLEMCGGSFTSHALFYSHKNRSYVTSATVNHVPCSKAEQENWVACKGIDLAFSRSCPEEFALNVTHVHTPRLGDELVAYGYGVHGKLWRGHFAGHPTSEQTQTVEAWHSKAIATTREFEYTVQGSDQEDGMSGCGCMNGCGYVVRLVLASLPSAC
jgi:hypothetical protein